ncbi:MAG: iron ABC transporter permease [Coriobacteriaceae bacterium]|jgi:iron complex transport system permease protein|nr:iron ABC transporter permease [Coriobacteriaceae bacterium]
MPRLAYAFREAWQARRSQTGQHDCGPQHDLALGEEKASVQAVGGQGTGEQDAPTTIDAAEKAFDSRLTPKKRLFLALALVLVAFLSFMLGKYAMSPLEVVQTVWYSLGGDLPAPDPARELVLYNIRLPRILVVMMVGAALSVAGASYQGMFKNPLTSPDLLGASAGASLGACLALLLSLGGEAVQLFAFIGGMLAVGMAVWLNKFVDYDPTLGLVLAGILVSTLFQSGMSLVKFMADANDKLPTITFWLMGSFSAIDRTDLVRCMVPMLVGFALLVSQSWKLNVLSFGDEEARSMGVNTRRTRLLVIFASTLVTSVSVAVAGIVGWIGLVIPHLARAVVGPNYRVLLPTSMFIGAIYLLLVDDIARLLATVEIPIGILTAIMGVPFFVFIFKHNMRGWR